MKTNFRPLLDCNLNKPRFFFNFIKKTLDGWGKSTFLLDGVVLRFAELSRGKSCLVKMCKVICMAYLWFCYQCMTHTYEIESIANYVLAPSPVKCPFSQENKSRCSKNEYFYCNLVFMPKSQSVVVHVYCIHSYNHLSQSEARKVFLGDLWVVLLGVLVFRFVSLDQYLSVP